MNKIYSGIRSRKTPIQIGILQSKIAYKLAKSGWVLRSGGAFGSDLFFEYGANCAKGTTEIYTPKTEKQNKNPQRNIDEAKWAWELDQLQPWENLKDWTQLLFRRNINQVLGPPHSRENILSRFVIYWTPTLNIYSKEAGGTRIAARAADKYKIELFNLLDSKIKERFESFVKDVTWEPDINELWKRTEIKQTSLEEMFTGN